HWTCRTNWRSVLQNRSPNSAVRLAPSLLFQGCSIPGSQFDCLGQDAVAILAKCQIVERELALVASECEDLAPRRGVPYLQYAVPFGRDQALAVRTEGNGADDASMPAHRAQLLACLRIPDRDGHVTAGRRQALAVWTEGECRSRHLFSPECQQGAA